MKVIIGLTKGEIIEIELSIKGNLGVANYFRENGVTEVLRPKTFDVLEWLEEGEILNVKIEEKEWKMLIKNLVEKR